MIKGEQVTSLVDQWHCLHSQPISAGAHLPTPSIDGYWTSVLASGKYPLVSMFVRAMFLPHRNADCERGFSENKRIVDSRANLGIVALNGIRHVKSYVKRFDSDPSKVPVTRDLVNAVKHSHRTYMERL
ncbi:hypothetical protein HPB51_015768 [Rhipicephalus microplus]|uniref:HAT C-terminal dimerisation domain-containing protein n=1 Tax=Rhipicephalus microplus TaxID=6941 RepID=A0A9J6EI79_RHIMP|nr:hypothetical protein HPB51_015768 [Rhipicephalus microplus]